MILITHVSLALCALGAAAQSPTPAAAHSSPTPLPFAPAAKDKVTVYSGCAVFDGKSFRPDMAIVTRGERIDSVVPVSQLQAPAGAEVVDMRGKFALPGLINSHEHLATPPDRKFAEAMMRRDVYGGVTAVRGMGDDVRALADYARASRVGEIPGPDIYYAALFGGRSFFDDPRTAAASQGVTPGTAPWMQAIDDKTDMANAVTMAKGTSAVAIKIYANLSGALVSKIAAEAHRQGLLAWAHGMVFPATPQEVIDARPDTVSHTCYLAYQAVDKRPTRYQDREKFRIDPAPFEKGENQVMAHLFDTMRQRNIILDATNYVYETIERMRAADPNNSPPPPYCSSYLAELLCRQAYQHHVSISAGTDSFSPADDQYPALYDEVEILVRKVGMKPEEALNSATTISAAAAGQQKEMGTLEAGKLANIAFFTSDPLDDIGALRTIDVTVKRGARFPRKDYRPLTPDEVEGRL
ncbi:MAG: amidohydrolase family protein [Chthoniobacterales bacterium]